MSDKLKKSIEIIKELLDCIDWLGGDSYEMEVAESMCENAYKFLEKNDENDKNVKLNFQLIDNNENFIILRQWEMLFIRRDNEKIYTVTNSKKQAKNILHTSLKNIKCIVSYYDIKSKKVKNFKWDNKNVIAIDY